MVSMLICIFKLEVILLFCYRDSGVFFKFIWFWFDNFEVVLCKFMFEDWYLCELLVVGNLYDFLIVVILVKKNIGVIGDIGFGKIMLMKLMC